MHEFWLKAALGMLAVVSVLTLCIALVAVETECLSQRPTPRVRRRCVYTTGRMRNPFEAVNADSGWGVSITTCPGPGTFGTQPVAVRSDQTPRKKLPVTARAPYAE